MRVFKLILAAAVAFLAAGCQPIGTAVRVDSISGDGASVTWVRIPGGAFQMGSNVGYGDEKPVHPVTVSTFEIAKTETTVAQYRRCFDAGACTAPDTGGSCNWAVPGRDDHPVNCIDWNQASAYAKWVGGRLPTEAEWEYAARSGGLDQKYPWGDQTATCPLAVMYDAGGNACGGDTTWSVCSRTAGETSHGLCDMSGNVWEWVQDRYHNGYEGAPSNSAAWEETGSDRVFRGGSWFDMAGSLRAAYRNVDAPGFRHNTLGLRPARSVP